MATRGSIILWYLCCCFFFFFLGGGGGIPKMFVSCNFQNILMVSDRAFKTCATLKQNPLEKMLIFAIYQDYTLALNPACGENAAKNDLGLR